MAGAATAIEPWPAMSHFQMEHMIPWLAGLAVVRGVGAPSALLVACLHVTALVHGNPSPSPSPSPALSRTRTALFAALSVPILYVPVTAVAMGGAMLTVYLGLGLRPSGFFHLLELADVGHGLQVAALLGVIASAWSFAARRLFSTSMRGLGSKLFVTWLLLFGVSIVLRTASAVVESPTARPAFPPLVEPPP
jgi:hypothetical protein